MESEFQKFKEMELQAWKHAGLAPEFESRLIRPSGSLDSPIAHHLNQPSFSTTFNSQLGNHETADKSNGCIAMVMGNAFHEGKTGSLIFDHVHRQSSNSEGIQDYPQEVVAVHEDFTRRIIESSSAKVEIIYGQVAQKRILATMEVTLLPLWGEYYGLFLGLLHETNFSNKQDGYRFRKVILFASHPQHLFYEKRQSHTLTRQDLTLKAAVSMADPTIQFDPEYHQLRKWHLHTPSIYQLAEQKAKEEARLEKLELYKDLFQLPLSQPDANQTAPQLDSGGWDIYFNKYLHSDSQIRLLLPRAIAAISTDTEQDWVTPDQFHPDVLEWFQGQKEVLFWYGPVSGCDDIAEAFEKCTAASKWNQSNDKLDAKREQPTMKKMLHCLMAIQQEKLQRITKKFETLFHSRFDGSKVLTKCPCGSEKATDDDPKFSIYRPGYYVACQSRKCRSMMCNGGCQFMRPVSNMNWVRKVQHCLEIVELKAPEPLWFGKAIRQEGQGPSRPSTVKLWCYRCKERTELYDGSKSFYDNNARWTHGNFRPLYVERRRACRNCRRKTGTDGRLVPVDDRIPSIVENSLRRFESNFGLYHSVIQAALLDHWPPSRKEPRLGDMVDHEEGTKAKPIEGKSVDVDEEPRNFNCPFHCGSVFATTAALSRHLENLHKIDKA